MNIINKYNSLTNTPSDINEHLPVLYKYATECESVLECGVRACISSWAFASGLLDNNKPIKKLLLNDIENCEKNIQDLLISSKYTNLTINYEWKNNLELELTENYDLLFIDTWHIYGQLKRELNKFSPKINKYIIMHDTTIDEIYGEMIRPNHAIIPITKEHLDIMPIEELHCGLGKAITEFLEINKNWIMVEKLTNNNGLTVLKRI
jgi:hypothetical protein